jgi:hypothetical protein
VSVGWRAKALKTRGKPKDGRSHQENHGILSSVILEVLLTCSNKVSSAVSFTPYPRKHSLRRKGWSSLVDIDAKDSNEYSGYLSSRDSTVVMDEGDSSGAGAILISIQRAYLLWLSDPRQEQKQRQLKALVERCSKHAQLFRGLFDGRST